MIERGLDDPEDGLDIRLQRFVELLVAELAEALAGMLFAASLSKVH
jgi:hypothetical protein